MALFFLLLATALCANLMHGIRTLARGENLWSKSEKQVQIDLLQFTFSRDPMLLADAARHMAVLKGDRTARIQLDSENPNYRIVAEQFVQGGNSPEDIPSAVRVYRLFGHVQLMSRALGAWRDADAGVNNLEGFLSELSALNSNEQSGQRATEIRNELMSNDSELTKREMTFSQTMNSAYSQAESILLITNVIAGVVLIFVAGVVSRKLTRSLRRSQLRDFVLTKANDELETRVRQRTAELEREIEERKQAEAELHWKTAFLEAQGNATVDGILVVDAEGEKIFQNQQFLRLWNTPQHIAGEKSDAQSLLYSVGLVKDPDKFLKRVHYLYNHPDETSRDEIELRDGKVLDRYSAPVLGKHGERYGRVWTFRDITERRRNENALHESEERFRLVVEGAPVGVCIQTDGLFRYLNPAALAMFGAENAEQIIGQCILDRMPSETYVAVNERIRLLNEERKVLPFPEERLLRLDGTFFDAEVTAVRFIFEGNEGALVFVRDITARKREEDRKSALEQQLRQAQKMEAVGRLAGGVAHDFNNLLMVIQTYTEMLQDRLPIQDSLRRNTEQVLKAAGRGASLTGQMLAFSRKQIVSPTVLDLNAVIEDTTKMLKRLIGEDVEFQVDSAESLWAIEADADQIAQVLMNLCVNSRDAMPRGGTLTIATGNVAWEGASIGKHADIPAGDYVRLAVTDTGTGIREELLEQIFEPFFTTKEVGKGSGLGLAMVYGIVKQSCGYVWVDSEPGKGAAFTIYLPKMTRAVSPKASVRPEAHPTGTEVLLVVEDEEFIREGICAFLRSLGYTVFAAGSGEEALQVAGEQKRIDLLLTDVVMPRMSGRELSQMLGSRRPDLKTIHMSGYTDDAVLRHGVHESNATFLQKPFSLGTLARKVRDTLGRAEPEQPQKRACKVVGH
jgi:PAS domain S-box-containing protein